MRREVSAVARFDSASTLLRALGRFLHGRDFPGLGMATTRIAAPLAARLPPAARRGIYRASGWYEGAPPRAVARLKEADLARFVVAHYPRRRYPAVLVGSANGAATHLAAALGAPWLPQTLLVLVRRRRDDVDDAAAELAWSRRHAARVLPADPALQVHHMIDPNQDRLMARHVAYLRIKRRRLGRVYERFLTRTLAPGGTIVLVDCRLRWPVTHVGPRHVFQFGAEGGLDPDDYRHGGPRIARFLAEQGSRRRRWDPPPADATMAEAEWGLEPALEADVVRVARERGYRLLRLSFDRPQQLAAPVAELYRHWYEARGHPASRLVVESFFLVEPWWMLRTGSVPFWTTFPVEPSVAAAEDYLRAADPYDHVHVTLFCHGVPSAGFAAADRWRDVIRLARAGGGWAGVDPDAFPLDLSVYAGYHDSLRRLPERLALPPPLSVSAATSLLGARDDVALSTVATGV